MTDDSFESPLCIDRTCPHPDTDHVRTPELASGSEIVVWCAGCRHHEVGEMRRHRLAFWRAERPRGRRRFAGPI